MTIPESQGMLKRKNEEKNHFNLNNLMHIIDILINCRNAGK